MKTHTFIITQARDAGGGGDDMTTRERYELHNRRVYQFEEAVEWLLVGAGFGCGVLLGWAIIAACASIIL